MSVLRGNITESLLWSKIIPDESPENPENMDHTDNLREKKYIKNMFKD